MKRISIGLSVLLATTLIVGNAFAGNVSVSGVSNSRDTAEQRQLEMKRRAELTYKIVKKWGPFVEEAYGMPARKWAMEMVPLLRDSSSTLMQRAADARTFDAMNSILLQSDKLSSNEGSATKLLGDIDNDLVFVPVTPCRILDTRLVGGVMAANTTRSFDVTAKSDYSTQGGASGNCGGVGAAGNFAIAALNFTVVNPVVGLTGGGTPGTGFITAYPLGAPQPLVATMVYKNDINLSNLTLTKLDQGASTNEMTVYTSHQTHLAADIVGYLIQPEATALNCQTISYIDNLIAGGAAIYATCPTNYTLTGGGCNSTSLGAVRGGTPQSTSNRYSCTFAGSDIEISAHAVCCQIPGRP